MRKISLLSLAFLLAGIITPTLVMGQLPSVTTTILSNVTCYGQSNGSALANPSGGFTPYTYQWLPGGQTTQTAIGLTAGTYVIHLKDNLARTASATATITQPSALSISAWARLGVVCPGQSDSIFSNSTGGTIPYHYFWNAPMDDVSCDTCASTNSFPYGMAYLVTAINDANGCTATASVNITVRPFPYVTVQGPLSPVLGSHNDTLIALSPGASSYVWSNGNTHSSIIVSPAITTTYSVKTTNTYGCYDTTRYIVSPNSSGDGSSSGSAIAVSPSTSVITTSYSTMDSVVWFSFTAADSNTQIIAYSGYLGMPVAHVHRLTLFNNSLQTLVDEPIPDIVGANQIRIDISHLTIGNTYYVRAARTPAHVNMAGCNPSTYGECNPLQRWDFQMCFRTVPVFVPKDLGAEAPDVSQLYYESRGQIPDLNNIPRFDIKAYTNNTKPAIFCSDSGVSFVYQHVDTAKSFIDTVQRVDMVLAGSSVQPSQPVFKMEEDSNAGYLNYFLGYVPNGVPKVEGYSRIVYKNVYPNTDMQVYSNTMGTKLYFVCNPTVGTSSGGNPANIELQFKGASSVSVNGGGGLDVVTELGTLTFASGFAYTDSAGIIKPKSWQANFVAVNSNTVKFNTGTFNSNEPLIIQVDRGHRAVGSHPPIDNLDWSTYVGATDEQSVFNDVCADAAGNVYATGYTQSAFYPVTNKVVQAKLAGGFSAVLAKFSNSVDSDKRLWSTYYGGNAQTGAYGVALDANDNIYITGYTQSTDLPLAYPGSSPHNYVQASLDTANGGRTNAFIAMFSNNGRTTYWVTYYGGGPGQDIEIGQHITIDKNNNVYVVGQGVSSYSHSYFPLQYSSKAGAYNDSTYGTGFILEFNASQAFNPSVGITREWATRIGDTIRNNGFRTSGLYGCAVDDSNNFYVTGYASGQGYTSPATLTFPYTSPTNNAVVTKFNANNHVVWSSYYGGSGGEDGRAITVDQLGNVYITGNSQSDSSNGIGIQTKKLGSGFFQRSNPYNANGYIAEFSDSGSLKWGTYFGGTGNLAGQAITTDGYYNLYVTGWDNAYNMSVPALNPYGVYNDTTFFGGQTLHDAFIAVFATAPVDPDYTWGTYFGNDLATGMCVTKSNGDNWLYIVGELGNGNTPLVFPPGSWQEDTFYFSPLTNEGNSFISQFDINPIVGPAGIHELGIKNGELEVYPNPTMQNVTMQLNLPETEQVNVTLFSLLGEVVYSENVEGQQGVFQKQVPLASLPNATYILKAETKDHVYYSKITKLQ